VPVLQSRLLKSTQAEIWRDGEEVKREVGGGTVEGEGNKEGLRD